MSARTSRLVPLAALAAGIMVWAGVAAVSQGQSPNQQSQAPAQHGQLNQQGQALNQQGQGPVQRTANMPVENNGERGWKVSELIGLSVHTSGDEDKGKIKDIMLGPDGRVEYAAVSFGGFLGIGDKLFAVPWDAIHLDWKENKINYARVDVTEDAVKQRQGFDENHWPERADRGFTTNQPMRNH
jgi:hypothetical protein